jgi:hypothetical protein
MAEIRRKLDFTPECCGRCWHCYYEMNVRMCVCGKQGGKPIGKNQYAYVCDDFLDQRDGEKKHSAECRY